MNSFPQLTFTVQVFKEGKQYVSFNPESVARRGLDI